MARPEGSTTESSGCALTVRHLLQFPGGGPLEFPQRGLHVGHGGGPDLEPGGVRHLGTHPLLHPHPATRVLETQDTAIARARRPAHRAAIQPDDEIGLGAILPGRGQREGSASAACALSNRRIRIFRQTASNGPVPSLMP